MNEQRRVAPTEAANPKTRNLDLMPTEALVALLVHEQCTAFEAVLASVPVLAHAVDAIAERLRAGGRLHYVGAGTSGRLGVLDAAESPPTFGTPPTLVRAHIAGGPDALVRAVEGAEDDAAAGEREAHSVVQPPDAVVGISASGGAKYVVAWLKTARERGALAVAITSDADSAAAGTADYVIALATGPEPLAGSTRMVAGTAQKLVLNALSTAVMVRLGKVYDNLMVDVSATNEKLRARALRLVQSLGEVDEPRARELLAGSGGSVKIAVVMARRGVDAAAARLLLDREGGSLRRLIGPSASSGSAR